MFAGSNLDRNFIRTLSGEAMLIENCYIGIDGKTYDVSNLTSRSVLADQRSKKTIVSNPLVKRRPMMKLYPSREDVRLQAPSIRDIGSLWQELEMSNNKDQAQQLRSHTMNEHILAPDEVDHTRSCATEKRSEARPGTSNYQLPAKNISKKKQAPSPQQETTNKKKDHCVRSLDIYQELSQVGKHDGPEVDTSRTEIRLDCDGHREQGEKRASIEIELAPGVNLPLRGADETEDAVRNGHLVAATCACCEASLFCIASAEYLYCPNCFVISPFHSESSGNCNLVYGVGLGLTPGTLRQVLEKIRAYELTN